jgi:hypothetical protein
MPGQRALHTRRRVQPEPVRLVHDHRLAHAASTCPHPTAVPAAGTPTTRTVAGRYDKLGQPEARPTR